MKAERRMNIRDESDVAMARKAARELATACGLPPDAVEALTTAVSEIARNTLVHGGGGELVARADEAGGRPGVVVVARDDGPGIEDLERAFTDGFSTGGTLGLGLSGARRLVDELEVVSAPGKGTTVTLRKWAQRGNRT